MSCILQITGLASTFNNTALKATIFLPKNEAFTALASSMGLDLNQVLTSNTPFTRYLGQVGPSSLASPQPWHVTAMSDIVLEHQHCPSHRRLK